MEEDKLAGGTKRSEELKWKRQGGGGIGGVPWTAGDLVPLWGSPFSPLPPLLPFLPPSPHQYVTCIITLILPTSPMALGEGEGGCEDRATQSPPRSDPRPLPLLGLVGEEV